MRRDVPLEKAYQLLKNSSSRAQREVVSLKDVPGRVLYERIQADHDMPPFNRSAMDGYAVRSIDVAAAVSERPVFLKVIGEVAAGTCSSFPVGPGEAVRIFTGAPLPSGADAVIRQEEVQVQGEKIAIQKPVPACNDLHLAGEDLSAGETVLEAGCIISHREVALLAALGVGLVPVYSRPRVAIVSTGRELVDVHVAPGPGQVRNSNLYSLASAVREAGAYPLSLATVGDSIEEIVSALEKACEEADLVITTGGVSVGDYDLVRPAYRALGAEELFWRLDLRPGKPTAAALWEGKMLIGLPGNPAATLIIFEVLVRPLVLAMGGRDAIFRPRVEAVLKEDLPKVNRERRFVRAKVEWDNGWYARAVGLDSSAVLSSLVRSNALLDLPPGNAPATAGTVIDTLLTAPIDSYFEESGCGATL